VRIIKIAFGIVLLLLAVLVLAGVLFELSVPARNHHADTAEPAWELFTVEILFSGMCLCGAYLLVRPAANDMAEVRCTQCGAHGGHAIAPSFKDRSRSRLAGHLGGVLLSVFYASGREQRFKCGQCGGMFFSHTAVSKAYRLLFFLFAAIILIHIYVEVSGG
jgi:hypothetical protein